MTAPFEFDRRLTDWLEDVGAASTPDYLDELLDHTRRTRQRPAWASLERWLPVQLSIVRRPLLAVPRAAWGVVILLLILATALLAIGYAGRQRLPAPFGPAKTGLVTFDAGGDIYVANADGSGERTLTTGPRDDIAPTFSLDGTRIAFWSAGNCQLTNELSSQTSCPGPFVLHVMSSDGSNLTTVDASVAELADASISWAPDGHRLVYIRKAADVAQLYVADLVHGTTTPVGDPRIPAANPVWGPHDDLIAFTGTIDPGHRAVFVVSAAGGQAVQLAAPVDGVDLGSVAWSPDGSEIATFAGNGAGGHDIWVVRADGTGMTNLTSSKDDEFYPVFSNDGTRIAYEQINDGTVRGSVQINDVWVMNADGRNKRKLPTTDITGAPPTWSPDDRDLFAYGADLTHVYLISVDGSHPQRPLAAPGKNYADGSFQRLAP